MPASDRHIAGADFFFSSRRRHTRFKCDWSSDECSSDLLHVSSGACGVGPAESTGKSSVTYCPGGTRAGSTSVRRLPWNPREKVIERQGRSEERREGKSVDLGGRRIIKKKKKRTRRSAGL